MKMLNKIFPVGVVTEIDRYTIEYEPVKSIDLMERAALAFIGKLLESFPECKDYAVVVGWGNNGGDGYAIARLLEERRCNVVVYRFMSGIEQSVDCMENSRRWKGKTCWVEKAEDVEPDRKAVIVDAIFGSGLNRPVTGLAGDVIRKINRCSNPVVAVDIPSGLMGEDNSGNDTEAIVKADFTFTFQFPKLAFMFPENARFVGKWTILDIGLHPDKISALQTPWSYLSEEEVAELLPSPDKFAHKGTNGKGLLIAGAYGMMGAAVMAAKAAVRSGIGLLICHVPRRGVDVMQQAVPESVIQTDQSEVAFSGVAWGADYSAVAVGPGIGSAPETVDGLHELLERWRGITILDADALNILSVHRELFELLHEGCILTPHPKEFERLVGKCENDFERLNKLSTFAARYRVCVVLKRAYTVIAFPSGECCFNMSGNPGMAKGGMGDVLTGVLLALCGSGIPWEASVKIGVYAHGLAGDIQAEEKGMRGVCAGEVAEHMGLAWKRLERVVMK